MQMSGILILIQPRSLNKRMFIDSSKVIKKIHSNRTITYFKSAKFNDIKSHVVQCKNVVCVYYLFNQIHGFSFP